MTESRPTVPQKKARWSRGAIRLLAWVSGSAAFLSVAGFLGLAPRPAAAQNTTTGTTPPVQKVIVRHVIRRVVIVDPATPTYTYTSSGSSSSSSGGGVSYSAPAPAPAPVSSGGSAPP
jgi:hypothetical protein